MDALLHRIIRQADLPQYCGLKRTQIYKLIERGEFPRPVQLSARRKGWLEHEIAAWQQNKLAKRDAVSASPGSDETASREDSAR